MDIRTQKTFEALFALEDIRETLRQTLPNITNSEEEHSIKEGVNRVRKILDDIEKGTGIPEVRKIAGTIDIRSREETHINIQPIQAAGRLTPEARKALIAYGDGYSTCDACRKPFRLDKITSPPIAPFHEQLASFVNMDVARVVPGARRGFQAVASTLVNKGDSVVVSSLAHYTEFLAVEEAGGIVREVPLDEHKLVTADATAEKIEEIKQETGKLPVLVMIDHFDYQYANEHDVKGIAKVAHQYDIPFLYNGAYTVGVRPVDGKDIGADFVVGSGHKSMASPAPSGVLATTEEWAPRVFRTTQMTGDLTKRKFGVKEVEMLGCTLMGSTLIGMMASFPAVRERVNNWEDELKKSNYLINGLLAIDGSRVVSEYPRKHTLSKINTSGNFDIIAQEHKRRGFFLSDELSRKGIVGEFAGATRVWKLNTYGLSWEKVRYVVDTFHDIADKYKLQINKENNSNGNK
ncbi:O-phospho-L-seryl-tRNA:Cys-tRNA synthase [Methanosarcina sp. Z-7115]|uniref:O-phospho-L-seryl-tRNA:Cys-tRNA synthase n=1 Tax=Methanosarcina baikalica TaxID=3073890 RepID=A0ABU2D514_9EURY|nr:O-phospho-L-seryl-tRNA:Cys-tRNA synthase [Methanosarcina sp. Z-7115]MDR7667045.1 O-phospho-L-seryl-tRNA:Cys-tRNA synthase [Methanosarcina sp. Z-7115]